MDGSNAGFLLDAPFFSAQAGGASSGILYVEDFDEKPREPRPEPVSEPAVPSFSAEDLAQAREAGRQEGLAAALEDSRLLQMQVQAAATQSLADAVAGLRPAFESIVQGSATQVSQTMLAVLQAALPATMRRHAPAELAALIAALAPGLAHEPELRVRAHPDLAEFTRETLIGALHTTGCVLSVSADPALQPGDVHLAWQDGQARRDCAAVWNAIAAALGPLGLPDFKEMTDVRGP